MDALSCLCFSPSVNWMQILRAEISFLQVTVGFTLFGKETLADLELKDITAEMD